MTRLDLDDLPPKVAALLTEVAPGEEVLLVQNGAVVARLLGVEAAAPAGGPEPDVPPEERAKEIFELFRSSVEDEF
jgi:antitoxin (DNA-binding transcriptional repressor) of toxin-antitoxin stability system